MQTGYAGCSTCSAEKGVTLRCSTSRGEILGSPMPAPSAASGKRASKRYYLTFARAAGRPPAQFR
jgi:hypothetical protein